MYQAFFSLFYFLSIFFCSFLHSEMLFEETNDITNVLMHLEEDTLFVFDLDNTLIETAQHLGSDQWFNHRLRWYLGEGLTLAEALEQAVSQLLAVHRFSEMRLVDPQIPDLLENIGKHPVHVIGMTKRDPSLIERTFEQLAPLQIDFSQTASIEHDLIFEELNHTTFKQGIIFVGNGIEKGPALEAFLKQLKSPPKKIVIVDDKLSHLQNIAQTLSNKRLIGIRYGATDEKVKAFNPKIAELQWLHLQKILSDEQALHLLHLESLKGG